MSEQQIGIVGVGNMGAGIAQKLAMEGFSVFVADANLERAQAGRDRIAASLDRIADALERLAPAKRPEIDWNAAQAFVWRSDLDWLEPVPNISRIEAELLLGIDRQKQILLDNCTDLKRDRYHQGAGLPNLSRMLLQT